MSFSTSAASPRTCCAATVGARGARGCTTTPHSDNGRRHTVIAGLRLTGLTAPAVFDGPIDNPSFLASVDQGLVPTLRPGAVVVLDHLIIHTQPEVRAAIERCGFRKF